MKKFYKKSSRRPRSRKGVIRKALRTGWKKSVAKVVKRVLSRNVEVKEANVSVSFTPRSTLATITQLASDNIVWCSPSASIMPIPQGTRQDERIGNKIRTKRCTFKMIMYPKPYNSIINPNPRPIVVTVWCCSAKKGYASPQDMATIFDTNFFQDGFQSTGYTSQLLDNVTATNDDAVRVYWKRTFKLGHSTHYAQPNQASEPYPSNVQYANNDYKMNVIRSFDITKQMLKTYSFDDSLNTPNQRTTFLVFGIANADGQLFTSGDHLPVDVYGHLCYTYTDA